MNNFIHLASGWNTNALSDQIYAQNHLFNKVKRKITKKELGYSHRQAELILLRYPILPANIITNKKSQQKVEDDLYAIKTPLWGKFPAASSLIYRLMELVQGTHLGGVGIVQLPSGSNIDAHYDKGLATSFYNRYHIVVNGPKKCWFICGKADDEERVEQLTGEAWWFDSHKLHSVRNESNDVRISMSIDINST